MERDAHHQGLLYISLKVPSKGISKFPIGTLQREMPITRAFCTYNLESPVKEPRLQVPLSKPHREGRSISKARLYSSLKDLGREPPTWFPNGAPMEREAHS
jgi:hypothetical protein